jgi:hypothetical protein
MAEFNLHARLDATTTEDVGPLFEPYTDREGVSTVETEEIEPVPEEEIHTPEQFLEIEGIETLAEIYADLLGQPEVASISMVGPTADRFAIPVQHYALQQIGNPKLYEFHAIDDQTTLVVAESQMELDKVRDEVPPGALGSPSSPI